MHFHTVQIPTRDLPKVSKRNDEPLDSEIFRIEFLLRSRNLKKSQVPPVFRKISGIDILCESNREIVLSVYLTKQIRPLLKFDRDRKQKLRFHFRRRRKVLD